MPKTFVIADTHFSHRRICEFLDNSGNKVRPWTDVEQMNEDLVKNWNSVVSPSDSVYHLGDFAMKREGVAIAERLIGRKFLIMGNHDIDYRKDLAKYFEVLPMKFFSGILLTHIPVHINQMQRFGVNVHGHTHGYNIPGPYFNVSVENINYTPITLEEVRARIEKKKFQEGESWMYAVGC